MWGKPFTLYDMEQYAIVSGLARCESKDIPQVILSAMLHTVMAEKEQNTPGVDRCSCAFTGSVQGLHKIFHPCHTVVYSYCNMLCEGLRYRWLKRSPSHFWTIHMMHERFCFAGNQASWQNQTLPESVESPYHNHLNVRGTMSVLVQIALNTTSTRQPIIANIYLV